MFTIEALQEMDAILTQIVKDIDKSDLTYSAYEMMTWNDALINDNTPRDPFYEPVRDTKRIQVIEFLSQIITFSNDLKKYIDKSYQASAEEQFKKVSLQLWTVMQKGMVAKQYLKSSKSNLMNTAIQRFSKITQECETKLQKEQQDLMEKLRLVTLSQRHQEEIYQSTTSLQLQEKELEQALVMVEQRNEKYQQLLVHAHRLKEKLPSTSPTYFNKMKHRIAELIKLLEEPACESIPAPSAKPTFFASALPAVKKDKDLLSIHALYEISFNIVRLYGLAANMISWGSFFSDLFVRTNRENQVRAYFDDVIDFRKKLTTYVTVQKTGRFSTILFLNEPTHEDLLVLNQELETFVSKLPPLLDFFRDYEKEALGVTLDLHQLYQLERKLVNVQNRNRELHNQIQICSEQLQAMQGLRSERDKLQGSCTALNQRLRKYKQKTEKYCEANKRLHVIQESLSSCSVESIKTQITAFCQFLLPAPPVPSTLFIAPVPSPIKIPARTERGVVFNAT